MDNEGFEILAKACVLDWYAENVEDPKMRPYTGQIFIVWMCKTLQNNKALLSSRLSDGMYFEVTYNGNKKELYVDAYKKVTNKCIERKVF